MPRIVVLGAGMVGGFIARTLAADPQHDVTVADRDAAALAALQSRARLSTNQADLSDSDVLRSVIDGADLVVGAVPGQLGYFVLETVLGAGISMVDISFCPEDALSLDALARQRGARAIVDCGVMPGLGGMLGARMAADLEADGATVTRLSIMVGGLPAVRRWPLEYKAPFSPADVLEEYTRPARLRRQGREVEVEALSGCELVDLPEVGTLEAFYTDGLRTLLSTLSIPDMEEKTLRYPGHAEKMRLLRELGFLDSAPVETRSGPVVPLELTSRLLDPHWQLDSGEPEFTVMRVEVEGRVGEGLAPSRSQPAGLAEQLSNGDPAAIAAGGRVQVPPLRDADEPSALLLRSCDLLDYTDPETGDSSMARTTGWPAVLAARLLLEGTWTRPGVSAPELLGLDDRAWGVMRDGLAAAGIGLRFSPDVAPAED